MKNQFQTLSNMAKEGHEEVLTIADGREALEVFAAENQMLLF